MTRLSSPGNWRNSLSHAFRSRSFLWKFAIGVMLAGVVIGYVTGKLQPPRPDKLGERVLALSGASLEKEDEDQPDDTPKPHDIDISPAFAREVGGTDVDFADVLWAVPLLAPYTSPDAREAMREVLRKRFKAEEADLAFDYLAAWDSTDVAALDRLKARADRANAPRFANYATGDIELRRKNYQAAYARFHKEGENADAHESRHAAIHALVEGKDFTTLATLTADPRYQRYVTSYVSLQMAIGRRDWRGILRESPLAQIESYKTDLLIVTLIAGLAWAFFLLHLGEVPRFFSKTTLLCLLGFGAGVLSTVPTIYLVIFEEKILHFTAGREVYHLFAYNIGGVAVREELCKLLLFLPLLPFLIRRNDELEALLVASFVGLGFAIEENSGYFMASEAASAPGRFLMANFFHIALTGVTGLALFRVWTRGIAGINEFLFIFPVAILAHGFYDALPDLPDSDIGGYASTIVYVVFATFYFSRVHPLRINVRMTLGLTGAFIISISVLAGTVIAFEMIDLGPAPGLTAVIPGFLGSAILLFMFFREFNEQLSA